MANHARARPVEAATIEQRICDGVQSARTAIGLLDQEGYWLQANRALCAFFGDDKLVPTTHTLRELVEPDDQDAANSAFLALLSGEIISYQLTTRSRRRRGRQQWVDLTLTRLDDGVSEPCFFVIIHDVTQHWDRELQAIARAHAALTLRDQFLSDVAHELKTPLTSVLGMSQFATWTLERSDDLDGGSLHKYLRVISDQACKLGKRIDQALDIAAWDDANLVLDRESIDVTALVDAVVRRFRATEESHPIVVQATDPITANVDPHRLEQAIRNLLDNAAQYSPAGTSVEVEVCTTRMTLSIAVTDHGTGISPEFRERIFERFYQAHRESYQSGLGLGLFISRYIVERHGGTLTADFPEAGGSRFLIQLPFL